MEQNDGSEKEAERAMAAARKIAKDILGIETFRQRGVAHLHESPTNPRRDTSEAALAELAESIRQHGILQPLVVRKTSTDGDFEVVCGSRRLRAARLAGLEEVPVTVRELSDEAVRVVQLEENVQREDLSPIDEAEGYQQLLNLNRSVEEISASCHKSKATIYGRLQLLNLPDAAVEALRSGQMPASIATLIGRIPVQELREQATEEILEGRMYSGVCMNFEDAKQLIRDRFTNRLQGAPFDPTDSDLLPDVRACANCPNRTGSNVDLFGDLAAGDGGSPDVCTMPPCFDRKRKANAEKVLQEAKLKGLKVLSEKEREKVFPHGRIHVVDGKYLELGDECRADSRRRTWAELLGEETPEIVVAVDGAGAVHHLVRRKEAQAALEAKCAWARPRQSSGSAPGQQSAWEIRRETADRSRRDILSAVVTVAEGDKMRTPSQNVWQALAAVAVSDATYHQPELVEEAAIRRSLLPEAGSAATSKKTPSQRIAGFLLSWLEEAGGSGARGLLFELLLGNGFVDLEPRSATERQIQAAADEVFGVDRKAIIAAVKENMKT